MNPPWSTQVASDAIRDGLGVELPCEPEDRIAAEVFRSDRDHTVIVRVFEDGIPQQVLAELVALAREWLEPFEDGADLPAVFEFERDIWSSS